MISRKQLSPVRYVSRLASSLLENILSGKDVIRTVERTIRAGEVVRPGEGWDF